jgi:hypothetical protein
LKEDGEGVLERVFICWVAVVAQGGGVGVGEVGEKELEGDE